MGYAPPGDWLQVEFLKGLSRDLLMMFNTFICDLEVMTECTLNESGDKTRPVGLVAMLIYLT